MIVLSALKTIGIVLLVILAVILVLLALVLFVPLRYKGEVKKNDTTGDELKVSLKVTWLLHLFSAVIEPLEEEKLSLRIAGIKLDLNKEKNKRKKSDKSKTEKKEDTAENIRKTSEAEESPAKPDLESDRTETSDNEEKEFIKSEDIRESLTVKADDAESPEEEKDPEIKQPGIREKIISLISKAAAFIKEKLTAAYKKLKEIIDSISAKINALFEKCSAVTRKAIEWKDFLDDEGNREGIAYMLSKCGKLLKKVLPKKLEGELDFGLEDPATTGQITAAASMLYPIYGNSFKLNPDFENEVFNGNANIAGKIRIIHVVIIGIKILIHKNSMKVIKFVKGQIQGG